ncbi:FAD-dependent oxidoreductase [Mesorhizobium sp. B2-3-4]|uniref:FAD-dependent oxidoreductase n=1 Tax=Mesorhizobium sp. B2-3-4 TaxID=2589959 RepID=UPI001FEFD227|nr:FAD-dependent oxidoreductase [Mesorhizobium sp. B2-3-4]
MPVQEANGGIALCLKGGAANGRRHRRQLWPGAVVPHGEVTRWMGHRPGTPDSIPVIDRVSRAKNVIYAFGHGHQGLIGGAVPGKDRVATRCWSAAGDRSRAVSGR